MRKIIFKTSLFIVPFMVLYLFTNSFYSKQKGDLFRLGYVFDDKSYDKIDLFKNEYESSRLFKNLSEIDLTDNNAFDVLTIGDSFSEQDNTGYQNFLASDNVKILHVDVFFHKNAIETINAFLNGDVLDKIKTKYIILESVERSFVNRREFDKEKIININNLLTLIDNHKENLENDPKSNDVKEDFFSREIIKFPLCNVLYNFSDNAINSVTYCVKTKRNLFSTNNNRLLFFNDDLKCVNDNNDELAVAQLNTKLNDLSAKLVKKGIKLIVLPCPDKFDFYYDDIVDNAKYTKPNFFEIFQKQPKKYLFVNSKKILKQESRDTKDIYFYDDTHWSPNASKIIAKELKQIINEN